MRRQYLKIVTICVLSLVGLLPVCVNAEEAAISGSWQKVIQYTKSLSWKQVFQQLKEFTERAYNLMLNKGSLVTRDITNNIFRVHIKDIAGIQRLSQDRILATLDKEQMHWVWYYAFNGVKNRLKRDPWIKDAVVAWNIYPLRLSLDIEEQQPWIVAEFDSESWLVSEEGSIIESLSSLERSNIIVESSELPRLDGLDQKEDNKSSLAGSNIRQRHAIALLLKLRRVGGVPFSVDRYTLLDDGGLKIIPKDSTIYPDVLIAAEEEKELVNGLKRLQVVLSDIELRGETAKQIDLRFSNRSVVEYTQPVPEPVSRKRK